MSAQDKTDSFKDYLDSAVVEIDEHATAGTVVLDRPTDRRLISDFRIESGNEHRCFEIDATSGRILVSNGVQLDFETQSEFCLVVSASPHEDSASRFEYEFQASLIDSGLSAETLRRLLNRRFEATVTIRLRDVNEPPDLKRQQFSIQESATGGTLIGLVTGSDPDDGDVLNYSVLSGNDDGTFEIDSTSGALSIRPSAQFDFEHVRQHDLTVQACDSDGLQATADVTVLIQDVDEPPVVDQTNLTWFIDADIPAEVGMISAVDPDTGAQLTFELRDDPTQGGFCIDQTSGIVSMIDGRRLRKFNSPQCRLTIDICDQTGNITTVPVTVDLRLPVAAPALPAVESPLPEANHKTSPRPGDNSQKRADSRSSRFNESLLKIIRDLTFLCGLIAIVYVLVTFHRRKVLQGRINTESPSPPPEVLLSDTEILELLIASESYINQQRRAAGESVEAVGQTTRVSTSSGESRSYVSDVENPSQFSDCPHRLNSSERIEHDDKDLTRSSEQTDHSSHDEVPDHARPATQPESSPDITPSDLTEETDYASPSSADSAGIDERAIRDYVSKLLERDERKVPKPVCNASSVPGQSPESTLKRRSADRDRAEYETPSSPPNEQAETEDIDEEDNQNDVGHEVRRSLREFTLREFLKNNMSYFREISRRASDAAIATATRRRLRKQIGPRIMLTAIFVTASLVTVVASILKFCEFGAIGQLLLLAAFSSVAELRLTVLRWQSSATTISDLNQQCGE